MTRAFCSPVEDFGSVFGEFHREAPGGRIAARNRTRVFPKDILLTECQQDFPAAGSGGCGLSGGRPHGDGRLSLIRGAECQ
jgi:hypothetical protein